MRFFWGGQHLPRLYLSRFASVRSCILALCVTWRDLQYVSAEDKQFHRAPRRIVPVTATLAGALVRRR